MGAFVDLTEASFANLMCQIEDVVLYFFEQL